MTGQAGRTCKRCGAPQHEDAAGGMCPRCLMVMNFESRTMPEDEVPSQAAPLSSVELAEKFPAFDIIECLGRGGMGVVYKARQKSLNRLVAIKILAPERMDEGGFAGRFTTEAELLAKLNHPHIVTIHDFGETGGLFYLVMEFIDGVNLRDLLRDGEIEPKQALAIIPPICDALQFAHDKGIVHRDIKPENILLDREGRVKIADFGIAKLIEPVAAVRDRRTSQEGNQRSRMGGTATLQAGTQGYSAPEQANGTADHRADIYSLGVVLYEMLTGQRPDKEFIAPSRKVRIDVRLDEMVLRALEKQPELRYQSAAEFRTVLQTVASAQRDSTRRKKRRKKVIFRFLDPVPGKNELLRLALTMMLAGIAIIVLIGDAWSKARERIAEAFDPERSSEGGMSETILWIFCLTLILALMWAWIRWSRHKRGNPHQSRTGPAWIIFGLVGIFLVFSNSWNPVTWTLIIAAALLLAAVELIPYHPGSAECRDT